MTRAQTSPLPVDPIERTNYLVRRSAPNIDRPRLPECDERALADSESRAAASYAAAEDAIDRLHRLADELSGDDVVLEPADD